MSRFYFYSILGLLTGCGAAVCLGKIDPDVSLESARAMWADVLRDADEIGLQATRVPAAQEMQLGDELAAQANTWGAEDPDAEKYVSAVAEPLLREVRRQDIHYHIHVIRSPGINAFALPGGHIYVLTGLLDFLQSEAELAAILGHEISHVDLRHAIERYQYQLAARKVGAPAVAIEIAHDLVAIGYTQDQELEADRSGERLAIEAGYDPDAMAAVFRRMHSRFREPPRRPATTPAGEAGGAVADMIGSYFRTHPPSAERARQLSQMVSENRRELVGKMVYRGVRNYQTRIPRNVREFPREKRIY
jgi:beta-barrel assembly-enhancing protease